MNISKFKALWMLLTGGWTGLAVYILEKVNEWLASLDHDRFSYVVRVVKAVSSALRTLKDVFLPDRYRNAMRKTLEALDVLVVALEDGEIKEAELVDSADALKAAILTWKETSK